MTKAISEIISANIENTKPTIFGWPPDCLQVFARRVMSNLLASKARSGKGLQHATRYLLLAPSMQLSEMAGPQLSWAGCEGIPREVTAR